MPRKPWTEEHRAAQRAATIASNKSRATHGLSKTPEYAIYSAMVGRCTSPKSEYFAIYGARGIRIADEWLGPGGFERFLAYVGPRPGPTLTLDRKDNDGHYEPGNVRWVTREEQQRNKRNNRLLVHNGEVATLAAWAERLGVGGDTIRSRLNRGWDVARALTVSVRPSGRGVGVTVDGETMTIAEWSRRTGTPQVSIANRLRSGWSPTEALYGRPSAPRRWTADEARAMSARAAEAKQAKRAGGD